MSQPIAIRICATLREFHLCVDLQREVWAEQDLEVEPSTMFVVASHTGGHVLGAFDGEQLVGYTLALAGLKGSAPYLHSHMTGVREEYRNRGVGRMLKLFQRQEALSRGIRLIEWTFDPLEMRNAYFNLNRLGAIARRYLPNLYGLTTSPLHRGLATDRLVAEWHLDSARAVAAIENLADPAVGATEEIELPTELDQWQHSDMQRVANVQAQVRERFQALLVKGYAALGTKRTTSGASYLLGPWSEF